MKSVNCLLGMYGRPQLFVTKTKDIFIANVSCHNTDFSLHSHNTEFSLHRDIPADIHHRMDS